MQDLTGMSIVQLDTTKLVIDIVIQDSVYAWRQKAWRINFDNIDLCVDGVSCFERKTFCPANILRSKIT